MRLDISGNLILRLCLGFIFIQSMIYTKMSTFYLTAFQLSLFLNSLARKLKLSLILSLKLWNLQIIGKNRFEKIQNMFKKRTFRVNW